MRVVVPSAPASSPKLSNSAFPRCFVFLSLYEFSQGALLPVDQIVDNVANISTLQWSR